MLLIGVSAVVFCYLLEGLLCFLTLKKLKAMATEIGLNQDGIGLACEQTIHVIALTGCIYLIPLIALVLALAFYPILIGTIILLIFGSTYFVTKWVLIPASEKKYGNTK